MEWYYEDNFLKKNLKDSWNCIFLRNTSAWLKCEYDLEIWDLVMSISTVVDIFLLRTFKYLQTFADQFLRNGPHVFSMSSSGNFLWISIFQRTGSQFYWLFMYPTENLRSCEVSIERVLKSMSGLQFKNFLFSELFKFLRIFLTFELFEYQNFIFL